MNGLVLDTNVVVSSALFGGSPRELAGLIRDAKVPLFSSAALVEELRQVLSRPKFQQKISRAGESVDSIVDLYVVAVTLVDPVLVPGVAPDPKDDIVIATALGAEAEFLVTGDKELLVIGSYRGVQIVSVSEAIRIIRNQKQSA